MSQVAGTVIDLPLVAVGAIIAIVSGIFVYRDAKSHGHRGAWAWATGATVLWTPAFFIYMAVIVLGRNTVGPNNRPSKILDSVRGRVPV